MADTSQDVTVPKGWVDAFTLTGITSTAALNIVNKAVMTEVVMQITADQPSNSDYSGITLTTQNKSYASVTTDILSSGVWLRSKGESVIVNISEV